MLDSVNDRNLCLPANRHGQRPHLILRPGLVEQITKPVNLPALFFIGPVFGQKVSSSRSFALGRGCRARLNAGFGFGIQLLRLWGSPALVGQAVYPNFGLIPASGYDEHIPDHDILARFDPLTIALDLTAINGLFGESASFKKPRRPQPFINSNFIHWAPITDLSRVTMTPAMRVGKS
jgi:hypothetical protein